MKFRSCPECRGNGKVVIASACPACNGEGTITDRQIIGMLGDLVSPEVLDKITAMVIEAEEGGR